jgi:hypothetical protein
MATSCRWCEKTVVGRSALSAAAVGGHLQLHSAARRHGVNTSRVDGDGESASWLLTDSSLSSFSADRR